MQQPRITSKNLKRIDLSDGSFVLVKGSIDYAVFEMYEKFASTEHADRSAYFKFGLDFLKLVVTDWNFVDDKGATIPYAPEMLDDLDLATIEELLPPVMQIYTAEKKSLTQSAPQ